MSLEKTSVQSSLQAGRRSSWPCLGTSCTLVLNTHCSPQVISTWAGTLACGCCLTCAEGTPSQCSQHCGQGSQHWMWESKSDFMRLRVPGPSGLSAGQHQAQTERNPEQEPPVPASYPAHLCKDGPWMENWRQTSRDLYIFEKCFWQGWVYFGAKILWNACLVFFTICAFYELGRHVSQSQFFPDPAGGQDVS